MFQGMMASRRLCLVVTSVFVLGCGEAGPELASVSGKLTKGGQPLAGVNVTFAPTNAGPSSGARTDAEGKFILICQSGKAGAVVGEHKAVLQAVASSAVDSNSDPKAAMEAMLKARSGGAKGKNVDPTKAAAAEAPFPPEYGDPAKTPLKYEVKAGTNEFDIAIP
jgi:hypothetical protein